MVPAATPAEEELHIGTREWCASNDVPLYERKGIGHQVAAEVGYATPGAFVGAFRRPCQPARHLRHARDGHPAQRARSLRVRDASRSRCRRPTRVNLRGTLQRGRDGARRVPPPRARAGPGLLPLPGARDRRAGGRRHVAPKACRRSPASRCSPARSRRSSTRTTKRAGLCAAARAQEARAGIQRPGRELRRRHDIDLTTSSRSSSFRRAPANTRDLTDYLGLEVQAGYLGLLRVGPARGPARRRQVLHGPPGEAAASRSTSSRPARRSWPPPRKEGLIDALVEAGAFVSSPSCDYCFGRIATMTRRPARGLDRHAQRARPHGQPGFRDLPVQCRRRRSLGDRRQDRRSAEVSLRLKEHHGTAQSARPRRLHLRRGSISTSTRSSASRTSRSTDIDELAGAAMQSYDPGLRERRCARAT